MKKIYPFFMILMVFFLTSEKSFSVKHLIEPHRDYSFARIVAGVGTALSSESMLNPGLGLSLGIEIGEPYKDNLVISYKYHNFSYELLGEDYSTRFESLHLGFKIVFGKTGLYTIPAVGMNTRLGDPKWIFGAGLGWDFLPITKKIHSFIQIGAYTYFDDMETLVYPIQIGFKFYMPETKKNI